MESKKTKNKVPRGIRNNNPLNIRKGSKWKGERPIQGDPAFEEFETMQMGIRAGLKLIRNHITGFNGSRPKRNTIQKLISVWAPPSENNTNSYVETVANLVGRYPFDIIYPDDRELICNIARAMAYVECGVLLDRDLFTSAWSLM